MLREIVLKQKKEKDRDIREMLKNSSIFSIFNILTRFYFSGITSIWHPSTKLTTR
jgi:hypothetical protein